MPKKSINIFDGSDSYKSDFIYIIYKQLMSRQWVSYFTVYNEWNPSIIEDSILRCGSIANVCITSLPRYSDLQKAFMLVRNAINAVEPNSIVNSGKRKRASYKYIGNDEDPLKPERDVLNNLVSKSLSDYIYFCKVSVGFFPSGWYSHFFKNTQESIDVCRASESWTVPIKTGMDQNLKNVEFLPMLYNAIISRNVLKITYRPFGKQDRTYLFHPQFLKEYNNRWFILGKAEKRKKYPFILSVDRLIGEPIIAEHIVYEDARQGFYKEYFDCIVGVKNDISDNIEVVEIKTHSEYIHNLLLSKPWHRTMKSVRDFGIQTNGDCCGIITLEVKPNKELKGKILMYGSQLTITKPDWLRNELRIELTKQLEGYQ